jgi:hypothetical protein
LNQLVVDAGAAANDGLADTYVVEQHADHLSVSVNGEEVSKTPRGQYDSITIQGSLDDDILIADFKSGEPVAGLEILFEAGDGGNDALTLQSEGSFSDVTHHFSEDGLHRIDLASGAGSSTVAHSGVESIDDRLVAANRVFQFTAGDEQIVLDDAGQADDDLSGLIATNLATGDLNVTFASPLDSLTITTATSDNGPDTVELAGLDENFDADLTIIGSEKDVLIVLGPRSERQYPSQCSA